MADVNQLTDFLLSTLKETKTFVVTQAPDVAREMLAYGVWDAEMSVFFGLCLLVIAVPVFLCAWKIKKHAYEGLVVLACIGGVTCLLFGGCLIADGVSKIKKIELAPKVYLIEQVTPHSCGK